MAFDQRSLDDYVDVAERITEFYDRYPDGCLRPLFGRDGHAWELANVTGYDKDGKEITQTFIVYTAAAYRWRDDNLPGVGVAWEVFPGRTPYTRGSEIMNAETSAWGRALAALGIATKRGIASRQEVAARRAERDDGLPTNADGSLSRSRTTDEQKDAAGVMTSGQHADHTELQKDAAKGKVSGTRRLASVPDDDPWYTDTPGPAKRATDSVRAGASGPGVKASQRDLGQYHAKFKQLGIENREQRLAMTVQVIGRAVSSSAELSKVECARVVAALDAKLEAR